MAKLFYVSNDVKNVVKVINNVVNVFNNVMYKKNMTFEAAFHTKILRILARFCR